MPLTLFAALLASAAPALAQVEGEVRRGELRTAVRVNGTVVPEDLFRLKSTIEGRVEGLVMSSTTWSRRGDDIALLANANLAAMIDSKGTATQEVLMTRWKKLYAPTPVRCPSDCFVTKFFTRNKALVKPGAVLLEAAKTLRLVGRVSPEDAHWIKEGQTVDLWPVSDPARRLRARVERFVLDVQGQQVRPGGSFSFKLSPKAYLDPGTPWEGEIVLKIKPSALHVPTRALIQYQGSVYLPVRVSTGITTADTTEITSGAEERRRFLALDADDMKGAHPHFQEYIPAAPPPPAPEPPPPPAPTIGEVAGAPTRPAAAADPPKPQEPARLTEPARRPQRRPREPSGDDDVDPYVRDKPSYEDD